MEIRLIYFCSFVLAAGILALGIFPLSSNSDPVLPKASVRTKQLPLQMEEFRYISQDQNRIVRVLQAQQLVIQPRRFMVFNIKSVNEAILQNAHFETHFYEKAVMHAPLIDYQEILPFSEGSRGNKHHNGSVVGLVTRSIAKGVRFDIFYEEERSIVLAAEYGLMEKKKSEAEFINAILRDSRSDRLIRSSRILWNEKRKVFVIPGAYTMSASGNKTSGESVEIDLDFNITPDVS